MYVLDFIIGVCYILCKQGCKFKLPQVTGVVTSVDKSFVSRRDVMRNILHFFTLFHEFLFFHFLEVISPHRYVLMFDVTTSDEYIRCCQLVSSWHGC